MLDAPDIGDEIPLSFDLQTSVYLVSSLLIEKQRGTWNKVQIWSYRKVQGYSEPGVLSLFWNKAVAISPLSHGLWTQSSMKQNKQFWLKIQCS